MTHILNVICAVAMIAVGCRWSNAERKGKVVTKRYSPERGQVFLCNLLLVNELRENFVQNYLNLFI